MIIRTIFLVFLSSIGIILTPFCQNSSFNNLSEAIKASKAVKKNLIIFRVNHTRLSFNPRLKGQSHSLVDSLIHTPVIQESFKKDYLFYSYIESQPIAADQMYLTQRFFYDESPNMIVLNDKEDCIAYIPLTSGIINEKLFEYTQNKIQEYRPQVMVLQKLGEKFKSKSISSSELEELIRERYLLRKRSITQWNYLALQKEEIPLTNAHHFVTKEAFSNKDAFFTYLMSSDLAELKIELLQNLKQKTINEADVEQYLYLKSACDSIRNLSLYGKSNPPKYTIAVTPEVKKYENEETMKLNVLYTNAGDEKMLVRTATMFARNLMNINKDDLAESGPVIIAGTDKDDIFGKLTVTNADGDTVKIKTMEDNSSVTARTIYSMYLAQIGWSFATVVKNQTNLMEAIVWCKKSIEWHSSKENNHVIARLYFLTGKPQKAIEHQKKAISLAIDEGITQKDIQFYRDALLRFESE